MAIILGENRYGKAENRVFRVTRTGDIHEVLDLNVSVQLSGDFADTHTSGDNANVLPTDTQKNTVFALSHQYGAMEPEAFGLLIARHFIASQKHVTKAEVRIEKFQWDRIVSQGSPHPHAFQRNGSMTRTATVLVCRNAQSTREFVVSGLENLVVLKTTDSEFKGYPRDQYTTLVETSDRIMATQVSARWRIAATDSTMLDGLNWALLFRESLDAMLTAFAQHHSLSLQQTLFTMGESVLSNQPAIAAIRLSLPNKHHFAVDLSPFGRENRNEVFIAADRPYGLIEAVIERDDAAPMTDAWPSW
jgi:urate oxidase